MAIEFYCGSGSPYGWRVWLALEYKNIEYNLRMLSFSAGDLQKPEFAKFNPRRLVPVIVDEGFALYESAAIVEYLEDRFSNTAQRLFPVDVQQRAIVRRLIREIDQYLATGVEQLVTQILFTAEENRDQSEIEHGRELVVRELAFFEKELSGNFLRENQVSAADFTLYPLIALLIRMEKKLRTLEINSVLGVNTRRWMQTIEALPYYGKTYPPHWKT